MHRALLESFVHPIGFVGLDEHVIRLFFLPIDWKRASTAKRFEVLCHRIHTCQYRDINVSVIGTSAPSWNTYDKEIYAAWAIKDSLMLDAVINNIETGLGDQICRIEYIWLEARAAPR